MYPYIYIVLPSYAVMAFIGGFLALLFIYFRLGKYKVDFTTFIKTFIMCVIGGYIGSKILFVLTQLPDLIKDFSIRNVFSQIIYSGYVFYGGLFGVICTIYLLTRSDSALRERIIKVTAPAIPLFHGFGRIGCFLAGCCYGRRLNPPIHLGNFAELDRIPVQIMESSYEFLLFFLLLWYERRETSDPLRLYLIAYASFRFFIEFLRGDSVRGIWGVFSTSQWISIFVLLFFTISYCMALKRRFDK